ncbi:MAG TPA: NADH:flavin oxidoreductase/NADH oxidase [Armatimonadota bacterium]|jgi:2,4-dienoyl-CoA reductase-like NADH-dependent reductase (Old Yellow Enzyme family)
MPTLLSTLRLRDVEFRNRIFVSPMCQYSARDGMPNEWHMVHLGSRAVGGAGLVIAEATAVSPIGRITPDDTGIWNDEQAAGWAPIARFLRENGASPGIQLAHAGRKASCLAPWKGSGSVPPEAGGWEPEAPSATPFAPDYAAPRAMTSADIARLVEEFRAATTRALAAGFEVVEIHMAHGYLLHQFLSPLSNRRSDEFGGSLENRMRLPLLVVDAVRAALPERLPLFVRISATDWADGGWDLAQSLTLARRARDRGVDLVDCSSGGLVPYAKIPAEAGYQVGFAAALRREARIATGAVGLILTPEQAEGIVARGDADAVLLARPFLRDPYWPLHAADALGAATPWPVQYERARPRK